MSAILEIIEGPHIGARLDVGAKVEIGRTLGEMRIPLDHAASRKHATITLEQGRHVIRDIGSTNGTEVNGVMVAEHVLRGGDRIRIGTSTFAFTEIPDPAGSVDDRTTNLRPFGGSAPAASDQIITPTNRDRAVHAVVAVLFPVIGALFGLYHLTKDAPESRNLGRYMLLWSGIGVLVWIIAGSWGAMQYMDAPGAPAQQIEQYPAPPPNAVN